MPKTTGGWINFAFKVIGGVVVAGPAIGVVGSYLGGKGDPSQAGSDFLYAYTGIGSGGQINSGQMATGLGSVAGGIALMYIGKLVGRAIR